MWYNIIPSFAITTTMLAIPAVFMAGLHKLVYDNYYERDLQFSYQRCMYLRDKRISGDPYKAVGLDGIPDEEATE